MQNSTVVVNAANGLVFEPGAGHGRGGRPVGQRQRCPQRPGGPAAPINLVVGSNNASTTYSGAISGSGSLTKAGGGILTLSTAINTYSGGTIVNGGTLAFATVPSGGSGNIVGSLTINPGATVNESGSWFLGYTPGADVNTININQGTLYFPATGNGISAGSVTMTGGTMSGPSGEGWTGTTATPTRLRSPLRQAASGPCSTAT